jgi:hypothetical protein
LWLTIAINFSNSLYDLKANLIEKKSNSCSFYSLNCLFCVKKIIVFFLSVLPSYLTYLTYLFLLGLRRVKARILLQLFSSLEAKLDLLKGIFPVKLQQ